MTNPDEAKHPTMFTNNLTELFKICSPLIESNSFNVNTLDQERQNIKMGWPNAANLVYDFSGKPTLNFMDYASKFELEFLYFTKQNKICQ